MATAAVVLVAAVVGVSARAMFLASGDVRLVLAAVTLGAGLGVLVAIRVSASLASDLRGVAEAAAQVADEDLTVHAGIDRRDEVGALATSVDRMVEQPCAAQQQRARDDAARQRLLTSIGHNLRTPLANLRAGIEAIQDGMATDPDRYLRRMAADVELLRSMVDDLFMLTRLEAGDLPLDQMALELTEIAAGAVESVTPLATRSGVNVELDADQPVPATGDRAS